MNEKDLEIDLKDAELVLDNAIWELANASKNTADAYTKYLSEKKALKEFIADKRNLSDNPY